VSLSNASVNRLLNDKFVCANVNIQGDPNSGESFSHLPRDPVGPCLRGNGEHNVQMITMSPSGEIYHVLSGYVGPEELLAELQFAEATWHELDKTEDADTRKKMLIAAHERFARESDTRRYDEDDTPIPGVMPGARDIRKFLPSGLGDEMQNLMAGFTGQRSALDHAFVIKHPLLPYKEYRSEELVGSAKTFFGSTGFGPDGGAESGERPAVEADGQPPRRSKKASAKRNSSASRSRDREPSER
jgi:hypothetical protein